MTTNNPTTSGVTEPAVNPADTIGGLEGVTIDDIHAARRTSFGHLSEASRSLADARVVLLHAGFGVDHPVCKAIDQQHAHVARLITWVRDPRRAIP